MCGVLAIAAAHQAFLASDCATKKTHWDNSTRLSTRFIDEWQVVSHVTDAPRQEVQRYERELGQLLNLKIMCIGMSNIASPASPDDDTVSPVDEGKLLSLLRSCGSLIAVQTLQSISRNDPTNIQPHVQLVLDILDALPTQMASALPRPRSGQAFIATFLAIVAIAECCRESFATGDVTLTWMFAILWTTQTPDLYQMSLEQREPAALIVLAYWATFLLGRAERQGCWCLSGIAHSLVQHVIDHVSGESDAVRAMVNDLAGVTNNVMI
ncbi:hypothetical protein ANO11243_034460 [Dothideomycetidae sp. 11243]|nr:hypothetical protein ANO11243_034460 [fungal sp. No.11243]